MSRIEELRELKAKIGLPQNYRIESQFWRLNNLYSVVDENQKMNTFRLRPVQADFLKSLWWRNTVLKSRQHGFSTVIDVWGGDTAMFTPNINFGIIADTLENAKELFRTKIITPYESMPEVLRATIPVKSKTMTSIEFGNGSKITVGTRFRSGTLGILHVSEFGRIAAERPEIAKEIISGSLEAVHQRGYAIFESTAKGRQGKFYEMVQTAQHQALLGQDLSPLDFQLLFYAWYDKPDNRLDFDEPIPPKLVKYFEEELQGKHGIKLDKQQKAYYASKWKTLGEEMWQEHPSIPEECFKVSIEGAYLKNELRVAREEGRIGEFPFDPGYQVITSWDLGMRDSMAIWFIQRVGMYWHLIDYYENSDIGFDHYVKILDEKAKDLGYRYAVDLIPHDGEVRGLMTGKKRIDVMRSKGMNPVKVPRPAKKLQSIARMRDLFPMLRFNEATCDKGIIHLENYRKKWNKLLAVWENEPLHDVHSNGADSLQTLAGGMDMARDALSRGTARQEPRRQRDPESNTDIQEALNTQASDAFSTSGQPRRQTQRRHSRNRGYTR